MFAQIEDQNRDRILEVVRQGYTHGRDSEWSHLIEAQPPLVTTSSPGLLESATTDTYLAIDIMRSPTGV